MQFLIIVLLRHPVPNVETSLESLRDPEEIHLRVTSFGKASLRRGATFGIGYTCMIYAAEDANKYSGNLLEVLKG